MTDVKQALYQIYQKRTQVIFDSNTVTRQITFFNTLDYRLNDEVTPYTIFFLFCIKVYSQYLALKDAGNISYAIAEVISKYLENEDLLKLISLVGWAVVDENLADLIKLAYNEVADVLDGISHLANGKATIYDVDKCLLYSDELKAINCIPLIFARYSEYNREYRTKEEIAINKVWDATCEIFYDFLLTNSKSMLTKL